MNPRTLSVANFSKLSLQIKFYLCEQILSQACPSYWVPGLRTAPLTGRKLRTALLTLPVKTVIYQTPIYSVVLFTNLNNNLLPETTPAAYVCSSLAISSATVACTLGVRMGSSRSFSYMVLSCCTPAAPSCTPQGSGRREACLPPCCTSLEACPGCLQKS